METHDKSAILFTRAVKAGKRVYYVDVKQDRNAKYYLSITESKRMQNASEEQPPVFEKHKVFLYQEDFAKFGEAFHEAVAFVQEQTEGAAGEDAPNDFRLEIDF